MKKVAVPYFTHPSVWTYILMGVWLGYYCYSQDYIGMYWYVFFLPIPIAPFFEWFAHKYILHMQIGKVQTIPLGDGLKKRDKITVDFNGISKEAEVLKIQGETMEVGYGWAKNIKPLRVFMHNLHYGHHEDPNYLPLVFAPILSVIILFAFMFGAAFLLTFNFAIACMFLLGIIAYYLHYEWMHLAHHIPGYKHIFPWSNKLKTAHQLHHYRNENYWWGITNILGDIILGTYKTHKEVDMSKTVKNINHD